MSELKCIGRDGVARTFDVRWDKDIFAEKWKFRVVTSPALPGGEAFHLDIEEISEGLGRVVMMNNYGVREYCGMGIPEALLPLASATLGMKLQSSPTLGTSSTPGASGIYRTPAATKVWNRLVNAGKATHLLADDIFELS